MPRRHPLLLIFLLAGLTGFLSERSAAADLDEPPSVDQPLDFERTGGAVGASFKVSLRVRPPEVQVGQSLILTVRIQAVRPAKRAPKRPKLWELKPYQALEKKGVVKIDRPDPKKADKPERTPDKQTWEFDYQVKVLNESLKNLPAFPFIYYRPPPSALMPGQFLTTYPDEVPVKVRPKPTPPALPAPPIKAPEVIFQLAEGPAVLERRSTARLPPWPEFALFLLLPPVVGGCWYVAWRRLYPDAAHRLRIRQSLAARQALQALQALGPADAEQRAYRVSRIAAGYLQQRLGLPTAEPTPAEVAACLEKAGSSEPMPGKAAEFFRACDAARFAPPQPSGAIDLSAEATRLIQSLEVEPWAGHQ